jgi:hypothetical protein
MRTSRSLRIHSLLEHARPPLSESRVEREENECV